MRALMAVFHPKRMSAFDPLQTLATTASERTRPIWFGGLSFGIPPAGPPTEATVMIWQ
jgi:hypothetical protein